MAETDDAISVRGVCKDFDGFEVLRDIVGGLAPKAPSPWERQPVEEPAVDPDELYGVLPRRPPHAVRRPRGDRPPGGRQPVP